MRVTIIEGSPEELADYEARTGMIGQISAVANAPEPGEESLPTGDGQMVGKISARLRSYIFGRARTPDIGGQVGTYIQRVLDLGGTEVTPGMSAASKDQLSDYLLVYNAGPRHYGAVAYVSAKNAGLTLRLTKDDVAGVTDPAVKFRNVQARNEYQINCPVRTPDAIDLAVELTQRALDKVRGNGTSAA